MFDSVALICARSPVSELGTVPGDAVTPTPPPPPPEESRTSTFLTGILVGGKERERERERGEEGGVKGRREEEGKRKENPRPQLLANLFLQSHLHIHHDSHVLLHLKGLLPVANCQVTQDEEAISG